MAMYQRLWEQRRRKAMGEGWVALATEMQAQVVVAVVACVEGTSLASLDRYDPCTKSSP